MSLLLIGVNHRSADLEVRERLYIPEDAAGDALRRLCALPGVGEGFLFSTCNRTEILVEAIDDMEEALGSMKRFLASERSFTVEELEGHLYVHRERDAVQHLFRLGVGLDSMILGEPQILGQVKDAYRIGAEAGSVGAVLGGLMQRAFAAAKKVRTESGIGRNPVSVSFAAVELAHQIFGDFDDRSVLILGAGDTAELTARHLVSHGARSILVANRTYSQAQALARSFGGEALSFDRLHDGLDVADITISSTSAQHLILHHADAVAMMRRRKNRPVFFIDLAVPRDLDPAINRIDNVYLYDLDDLRQVADAGIEQRRLAAKEAERMLDAEVEAYLAWTRSRQVVPTIVALREKLHGLRQNEVGRFDGRLSGLSAEERQAVDELTTSLINKILHTPIRHIKRVAASPEGGGRLDLIRQLFGLSRSVASEEADSGAQEEPRKAIGEDEKR